MLASLHKAYRGQLEEFVQPSFNLVVDMYRVRARLSLLLSPSCTASRARACVRQPLSAFINS